MHEISSSPNGQYDKLNILWILSESLRKLACIFAIAMSSISKCLLFSCSQLSCGWWKEGVQKNCSDSFLENHLTKWSLTKLCTIQLDFLFVNHLKRYLGQSDSNLKWNWTSNFCFTPIAFSLYVLVCILQTFYFEWMK